VTSGELGGRTFPTTIRRGKGQCIKLGRGLLALIQVCGWVGGWVGGWVRACVRACVRGLLTFFSEC
jgi:hypothetical protein